MSADTDARKLPRESERRRTFEHLLTHGVRIDRKRYLPGLDELRAMHSRMHGDGRLGALTTTTPTLEEGYSSDDLDRIVLERDREAGR